MTLKLILIALSPFVGFLLGALILRLIGAI